jgi:hypothetical protein
MLRHVNGMTQFGFSIVTFPCLCKPFQVFSMFSVHPKIKNLSFYQVKTHKWVEKTHKIIIINGLFCLSNFSAIWWLSPLPVTGLQI